MKPFEKTGGGPGGAPFFPAARRWPLVLGFFVLSLSLVPAQTLRPGTALRVLPTRYFDILFPRESEAAALLLSQQADGIYEELSQRLRTTLIKRVPVLITPHTELFNGYTQPYPYFHIVLFDTPLDIEWTAFENSLAQLFLHELTHAVSLSVRNPRAWRIFGDTLTLPAPYFAPLFMVEGVAVSFEGLGGFGRATDPLFREQVRQDIIEGKFLDGFQVSGGYDLPPRQGYYYQYGGLFSAYLQQTYGMETYARLWEALGQGKYRFSFFPYRSGFYRHFQDTYPVSFTQAWENFRESLALTGVLENPDEAGGFKGSLFLDALAPGGDGQVYLLSASQGRLYSFRPGESFQEGLSRRALKTVRAVGSGAYDLGVSPDGRRLLISGYRAAGALYTAEVREYTAQGRSTGRHWDHLYKARYFRDGLVGIAPEGHINTVVFIDSQGRRETLLRGGETLLFSGPEPLDSAWLAITAAVGGVREIWLYHYPSRRVFRLRAQDEEGNALWPQLRDLRAQGSRLLFSANPDDRLYKLGVVDLGPLPEVLPAAEAEPGGPQDGVFSPGEAGELRFWALDFSGGVFEPLAAGEDIYYRAAFSGRDALMRFPRQAPTQTFPVSLEPVDYSLPPPAEVPSRDEFRERYAPYRPLKYLNPLQYWLPLPLMGSGDRLGGPGFMTWLGDPADLNRLILTTGYNFVDRIAPVELEWSSLSLGFPLTLTLSDKIEEDSGQRLWRSTRGTLDAGFSWGLPGGGAFSLTGAGGIIFGAADNGKSRNPYSWSYQSPYWEVLGSMELSSLRRRAYEQYGRGASLSFQAEALFPFQSYRLAARFTGETRRLLGLPLPASLTFLGVHDNRGLNLEGKSAVPGLFFSINPIVNDQFKAPPGQNLPWLVQQDVEFQLFNFEVQDHLSHLYFNRFSLLLGLRSCLYRSTEEGPGYDLGEGFRMTQAGILTLKGLMTFLAIKMQPIQIEYGLWVSYNISNQVNRRGDMVSLGPVFEVSF
ncbi:MAG: hypothetical protein LBQ61_10380 [Spirochaetales bacterium]|jgi:hypothetical protein|nr:hypothetical protein [Spirochaetales bacterium]